MDARPAATTARKGPSAEEWRLISSAFAHHVGPEPGTYDDDQEEKVAERTPPSPASPRVARNKPQQWRRASTWPSCGTSSQPAAANGEQPSSTGADPSRRIHDDYVLLPKVCRISATGVVSWAKCRRTGTLYAVKSCRRACMSEDAWDAVMCGLEAHRRLQHPSIVRLEDVYFGKDAVHMVMENLTGGDLHDWIAQRGGRCSEREAAAVLRQLLEAVAYLHSLDVVHRDVKLENIMLDGPETRKVKLIDFGFATRWDGRSALSLPCGTFDYAAPELLKGAYTDKVDEWSIGVVAHCLLTGELPPRPHGGGSLRAGGPFVPVDCRAGRPGLSEKVRGLSEGAQDFILSFLARNPSRRLSAEAARSHVWLQQSAPIGPAAAGA